MTYPPECRVTAQDIADAIPSHSRHTLGTDATGPSSRAKTVPRPNGTELVMCRLVVRAGFTVDHRPASVSLNGNRAAYTLRIDAGAKGERVYVTFRTYAEAEALGVADLFPTHSAYLIVLPGVMTAKEALALARIRLAQAQDEVARAEKKVEMEGRKAAIDAGERYRAPKKNSKSLKTQ